MRFKICNLGVIKNMEIDLSKPFIIFAGKNGTGKTYASSFIYSFVWILGNAFYGGFHDGKYSLPVSRQLKSGLKGVLNPDTIFDWVSSILKNDKNNILEYLNLGIDEKDFICEIATSREEWKEELFNRSVKIDAKETVEKPSHSYTHKCTSTHNINHDAPFVAFPKSLGKATNAYKGCYEHLHEWFMKRGF